MVLGLSPQVIGLIALGVMLLLMLLRVPVAYAMMFIGLVGMAIMRGWNAGVQTVVTTLYNKFVSYSFSPIPMFILMGYLAFHAGILEELFDVARKWIGRFNGGLVNAGIIGGASIVETIFAIPGIGSYAIAGVQSKDYYVVQAYVLFSGCIYVLTNILIDLIYIALDPKIRAGEAVES